jgi:DNA (cytosine-5)-methyltransferase 1
VNQYSTVSLFSGGMGLDLGLHRTGRFRLLAAVERDAAACETIRTNHAAGRIGGGGFRLCEANIETLDPAILMADLGLRPGELDLVVGGPPCGSYSHAGRRLGVRDVNGLQLWQFLWFVEALRPRCWVMENVPGLQSARLSPGAPKGSVLRQFLADVPAEYRADVLIANAADYGTPQTRKRVLVVGNRLGRTVSLPLPTHGSAGTGLLPHRTFREAIVGLRDPTVAVARYTAKRQAVLDQVPAGRNWRALPTEVAREAMGKSYHGSDGRPGWFRRLAWDEPSPTLTTDPGAAMVCRCPPEETRPLSVAEYARLQGFPDEWVFCGKMADQYRQIGNAVPVPLGEVVGQAVAVLFDCDPGLRTVRRTSSHPRAERVKTAADFSQTSSHPPTAQQLAADFVVMLGDDVRRLIFSRPE